MIGYSVSSMNGEVTVYSVRLGGSGFEKCSFLIRVRRWVETLVRRKWMDTLVRSFVATAEGEK